MLKKDLQDTQYLLQSSYAENYLKPLVGSLHDGMNTFKLISYMHQDQECELRVNVRSLNLPFFKTFFIIDYSDIQPRFFFDNEVDNGFPYHTFVWKEKDDNYKFQHLFNCSIDYWPLSNKNIIDNVIFDENSNAIFLFYDKDPITCSFQWNNELNKWYATWYPSKKNWRGNNGEIKDIADPLTEFTTEGISVSNPDEANMIFKESMNSFFRYFQDTWKFDNENLCFYNTNSSFIKNAYSILVEYIYLISTDQCKLSNEYLVSENCISNRTIQSLIQNPIKQEWVILNPKNINEVDDWIEFKTLNGTVFRVVFKVTDYSVKIKSIKKIK
jgi:hypothetical protein